jgi:hypothetical protein
MGMAISVTCSCGRSLRAKDEAAGKRVRCPGCGNTVEVPAPVADVEDEALAGLMSAPNEYDMAPPPPPPLPSAAPPMMRPPPPPPGQPKNWGTPDLTPAGGKPAKAARQPRVVFEQGWFGNVNSGVIGGVLMIVIAVAWFGLGLMANRIFFYPPILAVIGLMSVFKGMTGGGD